MKKETWKTVETGIQESSLGRYRVRATALKPQTGKIGETQATLKKGATLLDARAALANLKSTIRGDKPPAESPQRMTLRSYSKQWIAGKAEYLGEGTCRKHALVLAHHILPDLGDYYCDAIVREDVQQWSTQAKLKTRKDGELYGRGTLITWWRTLKEMLQDMVADLRLEHDPTARVKAPLVKRAPRKERRTLTREQLALLLTLCEGTARGAEITMLALTGMRPGEVYGLRWGDVNTDGEVIHIKRSHSKGVVTDGGKTGEGRSPYMHPMVATALHAHKKRLIRRKLGWGEDDWVFPGRFGGARTAGSLRKAFVTLSTGIELDFVITPSVLRRTFNTLLQAEQVDKLVMWSQLGHSSDAMTAHYTHVTHERKRDAVLRVLGEGELGT